MALTSVGIYEFNAKDLIGHGAFAVVYKGRLKTVSNLSLLSSITIFTFMENCANDSTPGIGDNNSNLRPAS